MSNTNLSISAGIVSSTSVVNLASLASTAPAALSTAKPSNTAKATSNSTGNASSATNSIVTIQFHPPPQFLFLEENLSHCFAPLHKHHVPYLAHIGIERILNYSGRKFDTSVLTACEAHGIHHIQEVSIEAEDLENRSEIWKIEEWIALCVEDIISQSSHASTLIVGSTESYLDCVILACWRRVQSWNIVSIIAEFRQHTWPHKLFDYEQLIEAFNVRLVDVESLAPEFHTVNDHLKEEELKLISRYNLIDKEEELISMDEQDRIDTVLFRLFFSDRNKLLSEGITFDPSVSLVNEKDDDD